MTHQKTKKQQHETTTTLHRDSDEPLTFLEHLYELRSRLFWIALTLIVASSAAFVLKDPLVSFILAPLKGQQLVYLTIGGGFSFIFTVCLYAGAIFSIPVIIYHLYKFVQPVLGKTSRRLITNLVLASGALAIAGAAFGYFVAIQASLDFLMGFAEGAITSSVTAESYLNFIMMYTTGLAVVFQLPLLLFMFDHIKPFPPGSLLSSQRYVIVAAVIIAALITPTPDVVNQMIIAIPIIVIYQLGAVAIYFRRRTSRRKDSHKARSIPVMRKGMNTLPIKQIAASHHGSPRPVTIELTEYAPDPQPMIELESMIEAVIEVPPMIAVPITPQVVAPIRKGRYMDGLKMTTKPQVTVVPRHVSPSPVVQPLRRAMPATAPHQRYQKASIDGFSFV